MHSASCPSPPQDSLQGDLDIDHQRQLLATFGDAKIDPAHLSGDVKQKDPAQEAESVGGDTEGEGTRSHKRSPCIYFLSGYCRDGASCPNYHGDGSVM